VSLSLGFGFGWLFSFCVDKMGIVELQYFNGIQNKALCKRSRKQKFQCNSAPLT